MQQLVSKMILTDQKPLNVSELAMKLAPAQNHFGNGYEVTDFESLDQVPGALLLDPHLIHSSGQLHISDLTATASIASMGSGQEQQLSARKSASKKSRSKEAVIAAAQQQPPSTMVNGGEPNIDALDASGAACFRLTL